MILPNFLIIGAPKAGTTSLYHNLKAHPQVFMPLLKEVNYFNEDKAETEAGLKYYTSLFEDVSDEKALGEASTWYLFDEKSPERIQALLPDVKLIAILRNPAERIYSEYWMRRRRDVLDINIEQGSIANHFSQLIQDRSKENFIYFFYWKSLNRYLQLFDRSQIKVCLFEDLKQDPQSLYAELCDFLEVDKNQLPAPSDKIYNKGGNAKNGALFNVFENIRYKYAKELSKIIPKRAYEKLRYWYAGFRERFMMSDYSPLPSDVRATLTDIHRDDILQLQEFLGRDLSHWLKE